MARRTGHRTRNTPSPRDAAPSRVEPVVRETSVSSWVSERRAQHHELKSLKFDIDASCVNVLLYGLAPRFSSHVDGVWTQSETPTIDSVCDPILGIDAGDRYRRHIPSSTPSFHSSALAAHLDAAVHSFYVLLARSGKRFSEAYPCGCCGNITLWENDCPRRRPEFRKDKGDRSTKWETAAAAFASEYVTHYPQGDTVEHLL
ncbi:hypothetical protein EHS25_001820 [Saitozyma podzolica]|jgi:hypothetical protein|uniref:Uncharacterized protein n=1 Tax=Saitozyma podzolica TaxID=1890683 RepID=A0A427YFY6_9TREE|nr:hypothetical protein EHS25_001820 [Saitozyma podzolica]